MTGTNKKLRLLLWKDWKLTVRHPCRLALLIIIPLVGELLVLWLKHAVGTPHFGDESHESTNPTENPMIESNITMKADETKVAWTATGSGDFRDTARRVMSAFSAAGIEVMEFETEGKLTSYIKKPLNMNTKDDKPITICGVLFENPSGADRFCAPKLQVTLRFPGVMRKLQETWPTNEVFIRKEKPDSFIDNNYIDELFMLMQASISNSIFAQCGNQVLTAAVSQINVRQFPTPDHYEEDIYESLFKLIGIIIIVSFLLPFTSTVKLITTEKEYQLKESMKIMGLPNALHWSAWFIRTMILFFIIVLLMVIFYKIKVDGTAVFEKSSVTVLLVFFTLYAMASTCLSFLVSVIFDKAQSAAIAAALIWLITFIPAQIIIIHYDEINHVPKIVVSLFSNSAVTIGLYLLLEWEVNQAGSQWSNVCMPLSLHDKLTMGHVFLMLLFDSVLYLLITLYIESIFPGSFGVPKKWNFIFQTEYWFKEREISDVEDVPIEEHDIKPENFEEEPTDLEVGIYLNKLRKVFPKRIVAVSDLSLKMYEGQVTVLLGHNGAGKSTTMNMLTGMYPPTSGVAIVNGYDIAKETEAARESISICLQHNVLFDELTVREHLYFFAKLKGVTKENLRQEIDKYIALLDLEKKRNVKSKKLSGGMKRRLAIGIALCGNSKVVLLDEPTAGVDSSARHLFWNVIRQEKANRCILLSTHMMDEADVLGDRIAIMANGRLLCCGSPFFLKRLYGSGYKLTIEKGPECDTEQVTRLIQNYIPTATLLQDIKRELIYELNNKEVAKFEGMLRDLERNSKRLQVISFGLTATSMADVFLNTIEEEKGTPLPKVEKIREAMEEEHLMDTELRKRSKLCRDRALAMWYKRQVIFKGSWPLYILHCLIPIIFYLIVQELSRLTRMSVGNPPPLLLELKAYDQTVTTVVMTKNIENGTDESSMLIREMYTNYKTIVQSTGNELNDLGYQNEPSPTFETFILRKLKEDRAKNYRKFIIAASFEQDECTGWYTNYALHSVAISYNLLVNALMNRIPMSLDIRNWPLPLTKEDKLKSEKEGNSVLGSLRFSLAFLSGFVTLLPSRERLCKSKHLQFVSGVRGETFWSVHFFWCFILFVPPFILFVAVVAMYQNTMYSTASEIGRLFLFLLLFAWAMIPIIYFISFWFNVTANAYITVLIFVPLCGFAQMMLFIIKTTKGEWKKIVYDICLLLPPFCLFDALTQMENNYMALEQCKEKREECPYLEKDPCCPGKCTASKCIKYTVNYFAMKEPGVGRNVLYLIIPTLFYFCVLVFIEYSHVLVCKKKTPPKKKENENEKGEEQLESDVLEEKQTILSYNVNQLNEKYTLCLRDITKYYHNFLAVDHVCVGVEKGECFGLLGANGAGKTTTFKIMTGDTMKYHGDAFILGTSINNPRKVFGRVGYCPQFDALLDNMTGRETLFMYCLLRGIPRESINRTIKGMAGVLLFEEFLDKKVKTYSGGTKRKLSTAVTLVGHPEVIFLDEPTAGMDPVARKCVWAVLSAVRDSGTSIVFTSHSMDECEAICTKIVIMVNGQFKCLGSLQHLRNKYTQGFVLQIKVSTDGRETKDSLADSLESVKSHITVILPGATLRDEFSNFLVYLIPKENIEYSTMFGLMEKARKQVNIEDYSLTQTDLEQVFLTFVKHQTPSDKE